MTALAVDYFTNIFCFAGTQSASSMVEDNIPNLVDGNMNSLLTLPPSFEDIFGAVKSLNKFSAPDLDGFGGVFYHLFCDVIKDDLCSAASQLFSFGRLLPNYSACSVLLIPKLKEALSLD